MKDSGLTFGELVEELGVTTGCGLCHPFILRMLETGEVSFSSDASE